MAKRLDLGTEYPELTFWNKNVPNITFINKGDFREKELLQRLGLHNHPFRGSFATTDREEIIRRLSLVNFFVKNPDVSRVLYPEGNCEFTDYLSGAIHLPTSEQGFVDYHNPESEHNPFWQLVNSLTLNTGAAEDVPAGLQGLTDFLAKTKDSLEEAERKMAGEMTKEITKAIFLEGTVTFSWTRKMDDDISEPSKTKVYGYRKYSGTLSRLWRSIQVPRWTRKKKWKYTGLPYVLEAAATIYDEIRGLLFYKPLLLKRLPQGFSGVLQNYMKSLTRILRRSEVNDKDRVSIKIRFRFDSQGLRIRVANVEVNRRPEEGSIDYYSEDYLDSSFPGYYFLARRFLKRKNRRLEKEMDKIRRELCAKEILEGFRKEVRGICDERMTHIPSDKLDSWYKWVTVGQLYHDPKYTDAYRTLFEYRQYVHEHLKTLGWINLIARTEKARADEWKKPLCLPEILGNDQHLVSFENLVPFHLIGRKKPDKTGTEITAKDLIHISALPALNGQMVCINGQNAGGKTTIEEELLNAVYMVQSGLLPFASKFALNPKRVLGSVFLERGEGSTAELLLRKSKALLAAVEKHKKDGQNGILLTLDEVGSATGEVDGLDFGKRLLRKLAESNCSVLFSTQIYDLAVHARDQLGADCHSLDLEHKITPGITRSGLGNLMKKVGIEKMLQ